MGVEAPPPHSAGHTLASRGRPFAAAPFPFSLSHLARGDDGLAHVAAVVVVVHGGGAAVVAAAAVGAAVLVGEGQVLGGQACAGAGAAGAVLRVGADVDGLVGRHGFFQRGREVCVGVCGVSVFVRLRARRRREWGALLGAAAQNSSEGGQRCSLLFAPALTRTSSAAGLSARARPSLTPSPPKTHAETTPGPRPSSGRPTRVLGRGLPLPCGRGLAIGFGGRRRAAHACPRARRQRRPGSVSCSIGGAGLVTGQHRDATTKRRRRRRRRPRRSRQIQAASKRRARPGCVRTARTTPPRRPQPSITPLARPRCHT